MIFTTTIPPSQWPDAQVANNALPLRESGSTATWTNYDINGAQTEQLDAFNKIDPRPGSEYAFILKLGFGANAPGADELRIELEGDSSQTVRTWDNAALPRNSIINNPFVGGQYRPTGKSILILIPRGYNCDRLRIRLRKSANLDLDWVIFERLVGVIYPTLAFRGRFARHRTSKRSITGQEFTTAASPDRILHAPISIRNEPDDSIVALLNDLDGLLNFGFIPVGMDSAMLESAIPYRRDGLVRNMLVAKGFRGFSGHEGVDVHGASGRIELRETYAI